MDRYFSLPLNGHDTLSLLVLTVLGFLVVCSFWMLALGYIVNYFGKYQPVNKELTKIVGGLSLLMVAIIGNNVWLFAVSFFISGLLIASERFMVVLAAILNSDRKNVHKIPSFYDLAQTEIDEKHSEEAEASLATEEESQPPSPKGMESTPQETKPASTSFQQQREEIKARENILLNNFERNIQQHFGGKVLLRRYVRINTEVGPIAYDTLLVEQQSNRVLLGVEITHLSVMRLSRAKRSIEQALRKYKADFPLLISVIFSDYSPDVAAQLVAYKNGLKKTLPDVGIIFYQMEGEKVITINDEDLFVFLKTVLSSD